MELPDSLDAALKHGIGIVWAMRRRQLPVLPPRENMEVAVWSGPHPSPTFYGITVWFTGYRKPLHVLLKEHYAGIDFGLQPLKLNPLNYLLPLVPHGFHGRKVEIMLPLRKERK